MSEVLDGYEQWLKGAWLTLQLTVYGSGVALVLALVFGLAGTSRHAWIRVLNRVYVEFFRGTATLVLLFWFFYALPLVGIRLNSTMFAAVLALGLNIGAYGAEVVRGSIKAVPRAQYEATIALNFTPLQRMRRVLLPQGFALMLPPFGNLLIELMKGTAIVSLVGLTDLTTVSKNLQSSTGETVASFSLVLVIYFVIAQILQLFVRFAEARVDRMLGRRPSREPELGTLAAGAPGAGVAS
ncbi:MULTISPECIES: ectoine/hydroxyectoine ABC transporter permease subunit EhuC [Actinomadura]|uniref:Ectoine/hydroxyectoine ABC transporter permease subunit EhuC n=1 Tax=Actinomadura litoris TaxID=2678616 RepID=A0A7K1L475_9ACTN|nr:MULTISPECIES: ectoine/hydroxyectoine ABC transporter permease subunit EhuC [Actinomadura]MBT2209935.1 ectoine/hydroxyectoine ABC transporter permease subunit EhuC [Actinomadura sp. NEAU-AAG7]MUN39238.1 ectoine/hydroxyectoine ABC transporter permease subunit EhuC [Actinomadura litoris]